MRIKSPRQYRVQRTYYDEDLRRAALAAARRINATAYPGVYVGLTGPAYETRSEYRLVQTIGGDAVGKTRAESIIIDTNERVVTH